MDVDQKISLILIIVLIQALLIVTGTIDRARREFHQRLIARKRSKIESLDSQGKYELALPLLVKYEKEFPGEVYFKWMKARSLYKLKKIDEATSLFTEIAKSEPMWEQDARKYLNSIQEHNK